MKVSIMGKNGLKVVELNRRKAIRERCLNCSCWIPSEVLNCKFVDCQLYPFRTEEGKQNPKNRKEAIRKYCSWCMVGNVNEIRKCVSPTCPLIPYRLKQIDRTVKIHSDAEKVHIETISETKTEHGVSLYE